MRAIEAQERAADDLVSFYLTAQDGDITWEIAEPFLESARVRVVMVEQWASLERDEAGGARPYDAKLQPMPIGVCRSGHVITAHEWYHASMTAVSFSSRKPLVFGCFNEAKGGHRNRVTARRFMLGQGRDVCAFCTGVKGLASYHREMMSYQLTFMPFGNAYERFATFEALWLGLIVVTVDWPGAKRAYEGLPVVTIGSYEEINAENITAWTRRHGPALEDLGGFRRRHLSGHAWSRRIHAMASGRGAE